MGKVKIPVDNAYRDLIERANDGIVIIQDMQLKFVNPRLAEILGCTVEELLGTPFVDYVHPQDRVDVVDRYRRRMRGERLPSIYEVKLKRQDGSDILAELNVGVTTYQGRPAELAIVREITERRRLEQEVRKRQLYLEGVLESTPDAIVTLDIDRKVSEWNPGAEKVFGYSSEEASGRDLDALIARADREVFEQATRITQRVLAGRKVLRTESTRYRKDGTPVEVLLAGAPIRVEGELVGAVMAYTDITQRKQAEESLRKRTEQLEALRDVGLDIISELNLDDLLRSIVSRAIELVDATAGGFDLYRPDEEVLEFAIHIGYGADVAQECPGKANVLLGEGLAGKIWQTGQTIIVDDYLAWEGRSPAWADSMGHSADMGVPVEWGDEFLGVLEVRADAPRTFSEDDARLLELFATQAAIAIRNARMYEETQRRTAQLETLQRISAGITAQLEPGILLQSIVEQGCRLLGVKGGSLYLVDQVEGDLEQVVSYGYQRDHTGSRLAPGEGTAGKVLETGELVLVGEYYSWGGRASEWEREGLTASLGVPLKHGDQIIGTLGFDAVGQTRSFDEDDVWLATLFADQATIAIENARLYDETVYRLAETNSLFEVSRDIVSTLDLDEVLERVIGAAIEAIGPAEKGTLHLLDDDRGELVVRASVGFSPETIEAARFAPGEGYTGWVFANQQPLIVGDVKADPRTKPIDLPEVREERSALCVPLTFAGEAIGTLTLDNITRSEAFNHTHLDLLSIFGSQAAAAIRNARLHEETERRASRLRAVNRVARRANSSLYLDDLIEAVYQEIDATFNADAFFLALYDREASELDFRLSVDENTREPPHRRPLGPGLTASVVTAGEPLLIHDYEREREDLPPAETWGTDKISRSWLGVPMRAAGEVTGVISVQAYRPFAYDDEDQQLLSTIADQVAMALEKTRLYEESQRRANQAALLSEAGRHVSSELELDVLLDTIVSAVQESFDYHNVILLLLEEGDTPQADTPSEAGEKRLRTQSVAGAYADIISHDLSLAIGEGMIGYAAASGETQLSNDVSTDPHYVRKATEDTRSELAVPLKSGDRVIGVLDLQDDDLGAFDRLDVTTLETLSAQIAAAIENARLFQAERERSTQLATVSKVAESISSTLDPDEVLDRTVEMITEAFDYYYASILLLDEGKGDLAFKAAAGGFSNQTPVDFRQEVGEGMIGWVARQGETLLANDVSREPRYVPVYLTETKSELDVPLKYRDKVIGVLDLQSEQLNAFNEHDVMAMEALAGHVAAAIENARLFGVAKRRVAELRAVRQASLQLTSTLELEPVLETILERALNLVSADDAHVFLYDDEELTFGAAMWGGERHEEPFDTIRPHGLTYTVARRGERIVVCDAMNDPIFEDRRWEGAIVGLPLTIGDEVQGVMNIAYQHPHAFTDEELWVLDLLADQAAIAIRNARLYDEIRDRALEQETLREAALALTTALERDEVVERVLAQLQRVVPYDTASVLLLRGGQERPPSVETSSTAVDIVGGRGFPNLSEIVGLSFPLNQEHPNREVIRTGEPLILEDAPEVYEAFRREPHAMAGIRSWLGVPMLVGDRTIGMIALDKRVPGFYTDEHAQMAQAFAAQAAVAFENARLYEAEQEQRELSERLRETALLLNRSLNLQEVLEMILEQLASVIEYDSGSIQILEDDGTPRTEVIAARNLPGREIGHAYPLERYPYNRRLVEEAKPLVIDDILEDCLGWRQAEGLGHVRANIGVPLQVRDQVIGILTVDSRHTEAYTEDEARVIQAFAQQAAVAIENARLFERERKQRRVSEALEEAAAAVGGTLELEEVLDRILEQVARVVDGDAFNVMLVEDGRAQICRWRGYEQFGAVPFVSSAEFQVPEVRSLLEMSQTRRPLVIRDTSTYEGWVDVPAQRWVKSYMGAPIQLGGTTVGYLNADSAQIERFGSEDARRLAAFAGHAATAIENARLYREAQKRALEQQTLREAALAMTTALEPDEVVERILAQLQEVVPYDTASVQLLHDDQLEIVGGRGLANLGELLGVAFDVAKEDNPSRAVIRTREPVILTRGRASYEAFQREPHAEAEMRSWLGVPMLVGDRVIGMITLDKREPEFYSQEHARLAEAFAAQAGIAIEKAQLHQETVRQLAETEVLRETMLAAASTLDFDEVLARTVEVLERAMGIEYLGFMLPDEDRSTGDTFMVSHACMLGFEPPEGGYRFPVDECLTGQVYQTGEPRILSDVHGEGPYAAAANDVRSELAVPVRAGDEVVAVLNLESGHPDAFDEQDLAFYTTIAGQLGIAMENAQLFEAEREQRRLSEALEKAAVAVSSTLDLEQVLDRILEQVEGVVPGDSFNIMLIDDDEARVVRWRGHERLGVSGEMSGHSFLVSDYPHWVAMSRTGEPVRVFDVALDDEWTTRDGWDWLRSYVAAPIRVGDTTVGFLNVGGTEPGRFSPGDAHRLETFASHAATAIENARLYERLRDHADTLESRVAERTAQLQAQYGRLEAILDSTVNGIVVTGRDGRLLLANPVAREWLTQTLSSQDASLLRRTIREMAERAQERPPGDASTGSTQSPEEVLELSDLDLQLRAAMIQEPGVEEATAVVAIHDISHIKALDRMKSRFVSNVSHELRTPIATIKLFAHLMQKQPRRWREYLEPLAQEAEHQAALVEDILEISRVDAGRLEIKPERVNLEELVDMVVGNSQARVQEQGLRLERGDLVCARSSESDGLDQLTTASGTSSAPVALVDTQRMTQVLDNLINNAIRYTPEGGKITVSTRTTEARGHAWVTVTVADTGMGIPEDELPHVFERFFRGERPRTMQISGTGLGLAIVKEIVELHRGRVTVESEVGEGSRFTIWLPLVQRQQ